MSSALRYRPLLLPVTLLLLASCGHRHETSPEEVYAKARAAVQSKDWRTFVTMTVPEERPRNSLEWAMTVELLRCITDGDEAEALDRDIAAFRSKHGIEDWRESAKSQDLLTDDAEKRRLASLKFSKVDHGALIADAMALMERYSGGEIAKLPGEDLITLTFGPLLDEGPDVIVSGDHATCTTASGKVYFEKRVASWYIARWEHGLTTVGETKLEQALPSFTAELEEALSRQGRADLASQVRGLPLVDRCRCGEHFCATLYTAPKPDGAYGPGHENLEVEMDKGMVILDLVRDEIMCIEILDRPDVQRALFAVLP